jgi:hypothetical protein
MESIHILAQLFFCRGLVFFLLTPAAIASVAFGTIIKTDLERPVYKAVNGDNILVMEDGFSFLNYNGLTTISTAHLQTIFDTILLVSKY